MSVNISRKLKVAFLDLGERWSRSMILGLRSLDIDLVPLQAYRCSSLRELQSALDDINPDFCVCRNFFLLQPRCIDSTTYQEFFETNKHRFVVWYHDAVHISDDEPLAKAWRTHRSPRNSIFCSIDGADADFFKQRSLPFLHLPMAAGEHFFWIQNRSALEKIAQEKCPGLVTFVGSQMIETDGLALSNEEFKNLCTHAISDHLHASLSQADSPKLEKMALDLFATSIKNGSDFRALIRKYIESGSPLEDRLVTIVNIYSWYRLTLFVRNLLPEGLRVYGSEFWKPLLSDYSFTTPSLSEEELVACYLNSKIGLSYTKFHFTEAVHERPFNILAAGGFPLTDEKKDLWDLFEKDEIAVYSSEEEARDKIRYFLKNESERLKIQESGRRAVESRHRYQHRLQKLVDFAVQEFGLSGRSKSC